MENSTGHRLHVEAADVLIPLISVSFMRFRCQTYEGGFGGCPGMEAHGGYSFCGVAALTLLNKTKLCDIDAVLVSLTVILNLS